MFLDRFAYQFCSNLPVHQIIIGRDFNENILLLEGIESQRKKYINDFVSDHQLCAMKVGLTYCHTSGPATS
jgi:hypothetical protein